MSLKFAANLSTMFKEYENLADRYYAAKNYGFKAVEMQHPYDCSINTLKSALSETGMEQILINSFPGDLSKGDFGFTAKPHYKEEFRRSLDLSVRYANALNCKRIHILAGLSSKYTHDTETESTYIDNLQTAIEALEKDGITALIEPITHVTKPLYFLSSFEQAVQYIKEIDSKNLKLQLDTFHLQMICGNLTNNIKEFLPLTGHIQVSQVPFRDEPSAKGELDYRYIFSLLEELGYNEWIGLEYTPQKDTISGLQWIEEYGYKL